MSPTHIGRYEIQRRLGHGGMGSVYLARDPVVDRDVVVRLFLVGTDAPDARARIEHTVRSASALRHPHIAAVYDFGEHESHPYVVTEFVEGETLARVIRHNSTVGIQDKLRWIEEVCEGASHAHRMQIVHGYLTPSEVMIDNAGSVKLLDFGIEREAGLSSNTGVLLGTPGYMAPEQIAGDPIDARTDQFAMGAVFYELLTGSKAFPGETPVAIVNRTLQAPPVPLAQLAPDVPSEIAGIVERTLRSHPDERFPDSESLRLAVARARHRLVVDAEPDTPVILIEPHAGPSVPPPVRPDPVQPGATDLDEDPVVSFAGQSLQASTPKALDENVQFTVFRPKALAPAVWHTMLVFAHLSEPRADASPDEPHPVKEMERQAEAVLGTLDAHGWQTVDSLEAVPRDGELTFVPRAEGITFNPASRRFTWTESVHREEFRLRADAGAPRETIRGRLSVYLGSLIIAEVGLTFRIGGDADSAARETVRDVARRYRKIFASYSHLDRPVVDEFTEYARAMGDRYLRDVIDLRAGERWQTALEDLIRQADVFQLFWSWNALASPHVRHEWQYALSLQRAAFIRPVYWDDPLPTRGDLPPAALNALHFERIRPRRSLPRETPTPPVARPTEPAEMAPPSSYDLDRTTIGIPTAPPQRHTAAPPPQARRPWRIIGSIAAGIVLFVVGAGVWLPMREAPSPSLGDPAETPPGQTVSPGNPLPPVPTQPMSQLTIRIHASDAEDASEAEAELVEIESGETVADEAANDQGTIVFERVPGGRYRLIVSVPDHPDVVRDVDVDGDQTVEIDFDGR